MTYANSPTVNHLKILKMSAYVRKTWSTRINIAAGTTSQS